ncbi:hypothetical protein ACQP00_16950 [Dactylosporangium sp. CS-047395]|uniref:hypothetical protein n=1 Tax=Dactylosporangium sp. CS-047395 TaxID=3239936 RepID=UPI003D8A5572
MRWLRLYLRCRRVPRALAVAVGATVLVRLVSPDVRVAALTAMLAAVAFAPTLGGIVLERTASVRWPPRRAAHVAGVALVVAAVVGAGFGLPTVVGAGFGPPTVVAAGFGPPAVVVRDAAGLAGLVALGASVVGAAHAWIAPLLWTLVAVLPLVGPGDDVGVQLAAWPVQPASSVVAALCAGVLAVGGLVAYAVRE